MHLRQKSRDGNHGRWGDISFSLKNISSYHQIFFSFLRNYCQIFFFFQRNYHQPFFLELCCCILLQVIRRLRERNEPILLFGETEHEAFERLKKLEASEPDFNIVSQQPELNAGNLHY